MTQRPRITDIVIHGVKKSEREDLQAKRRAFWLLHHARNFCTFLKSKLWSIARYGTEQSTHDQRSSHPEVSQSWQTLDAR